MSVAIHTVFINGSYKSKTSYEHVFEKQNYFSIFDTIVVFVHKENIVFLTTCATTMTEPNPIRTIADNMMALLERKNAPMNVKMVEKLSNVDHARFKLVFDFLVKFDVIKYTLDDQTVILNDSLFIQNH